MPIQTTAEQDRQIAALASEYDSVQVFGSSLTPGAEQVSVSLYTDSQRGFDTRHIAPDGLCLGPCRCPDCGYDADGCLRVTDEGQITDDASDSRSDGLVACPNCWQAWELESMMARRPSGNEADLQGAEA